MKNGKEWQEGYDARMDEVSDEDNPYEEKSEQYEEWERGWQQADYELESEDKENE